MSDPIDKAQEREQHLREAYLQIHKENNPMPLRASAHYCESCDEPIPQKRREIVQGCIYCVDCQREYEHEKTRRPA